MNAITLAATALTFVVLSALGPQPLPPQPTMTPDYESEYLLDMLLEAWGPTCLQAHEIKPHDGVRYSCYGV